MTLSCTMACCDWILTNHKIDDQDWARDWIITNHGKISDKAYKPRVKIYRYLIAPNVSLGDKQLSLLNALYGRGVSVTAKASIPDSIVKSVLEIHPNELVEGFEMHRDFHQRVGYPSVQTGIVSNMVAAMFLAFGKDLGLVGECSQAFINIRKGKRSGNVDVELKMPSIALGIEKSSMALPTQSDCLKMVGCDGGPDSNHKLAEIIASVCLGAELSFMASFITNTNSKPYDTHGKIDQMEPFEFHMKFHPGI